MECINFVDNAGLCAMGFTLEPCRKHECGVPEKPPGRIERLIQPSLRTCLLLFSTLLLIYTITLQTSFTLDCMPNTYLPLAILKHGSISLSHFPELYASGRPYYLVPHGSGLHSIFGIGAPLFALPFYLPFLFRESTPSIVTLIYVSKFVASFYVALSAALLFASLRRLTGGQRALLITIVYALATPAFCTASQALWQHAPSLFLLSLTAYFMVRGLEKPGWSSWSALPLGFSVLVRTTNLVFILPVSIYMIARRRRELPLFLLLLLPGAAATALYNQSAYGSLFRFPLMAPRYLLPKSEFMAYNEYHGFWKTPFFTGFFGNLISPSRGLLMISPVLILSFIGAALLLMSLRRKELSHSALILCFLLAFLAQLLLISKKTDWTGGSSFGNRLLIDTLPFLCFLFLPALERLDRLGRTPLRKLAWSVFISLLVLSLCLQLIGIIPYDHGSWNLRGSLDKLAWEWKDSQIMFYLRHPQPVTPPLIKAITGRVAELEDIEISVFEGRPRLFFHLSEFSRIIWIVTPKNTEGTEYSLPFYASKGENDLLFDAEYFGPDGFLTMQRLVSSLKLPCRHEFAVFDTLVGIEERYVFETASVAQ